MRLSELVAQIPGVSLVGEGDPEITAVIYDTRRAVVPGSLFVCIRGHNFDGHEFASKAVASGAVAVLCARRLELPHHVVQAIVEDTRFGMGWAASAFYGHPSKRMRLIGVTGTNGKTTTTHLIKSLLEQAGHKVGLVGTIHHLIGDEELPAARTTPESLDLQALFARMMEAGVTYAVTEVSSHGVVLQRTTGSEYDVGVFTNLTQDHLDFHASLDEYLAAKREFLRSLTGGSKTNKAAILNADDLYVGQMLEGVRAPVVTFGIEKSADVRAVDVEVLPTGVTYVAESPRGKLNIRLNLTGRFNVYNSLAAIAVALHEGLSLEDVEAGLASVPGVPGRFELVDLGQPFAVVVDYAHTPDGLKNVLETARGFTKGRTIAIFGCGGDRDRSKRPLMGEVAARLADFVVITSDNPRTEEPEAICKDVEEGVRAVGGTPYTIVVNRQEAIQYAVNAAKPGDTLVIAGKGHETYQIFKDNTIPFHDRQEAARALRERMQHGEASR